MLARLALRDFRNISECDVNFAPGATLFRGLNGQGKTNLLEAVYYISSLRSFRQAAGSQLIRQGASSFEIRAWLSKPQAEELHITVEEDRRRQLEVNGNKVGRAVDFVGRLHCVILHPADMKLVRGRHQERLRWLDYSICQIEPAHLHALARFQRCLKLRNSALKQRLGGSELEALSENYETTSRQVVDGRQRHWPELRDRVAEAYDSISRSAEPLEANYGSDVDERFGERLAASLYRDREAGATQVGPHRDRVEISLGGLEAADSSSEGQARSLALAFKIAQARFIKEALGRPPVLLIDDVWGELDEGRRRGLEELMAISPQLLLTATDVSSRGIPEVARSAAVWEVSKGALRRA